MAIHTAYYIPYIVEIAAIIILAIVIIVGLGVIIGAVLYCIYRRQHKQNPSRVSAGKKETCGKA